MRLRISGSPWTASEFQHDRTAADAKQPRAPSLRRRLDLPQKRDPIAAGKDLKRHGEHAASGIPIDLELGAVDIDAAVGVVAIVDGAGIGDDRPVSDCGTPFGPISPRKLADSGTLISQAAVAEPGRQQQIVGGYLARLQLNAAIAVPGRLDRSRQSPRSLRIIRTHRHDNAAAVRPLDTETDILKRPSLAGARVVDSERTVLQSKFTQVVAIEFGFADAVDPGQQRGDTVAGRPRQRRPSLRRSVGGSPRRGFIRRVLIFILLRFLAVDEQPRRRSACWPSRSGACRRRRRTR